MYVRLAFAVAAHLESEILIVDEVLAVGDAEFQKKCLGKMNDVSSKEGRTVLFVSHNMLAMKQLCNIGMMMQNGLLKYEGPMNEVAEKYLVAGITKASEAVWDGANEPGNENISIKKVKAAALGKSSQDPIKTSDQILIEVEFENKQNDIDLDVTWDMFDVEMAHVFHIGTRVDDEKKITSGNYKVSFKIPANLLNNKRYSFNITFGIDQRYVAYRHEGILTIDVEDALQRQGASIHQYPGVIHPAFEWERKKLQNFNVGQPLLQ